MDNKFTKIIIRFFKRKEVIALTIIALLTLAVYAPCINYPFVSDDTYRVELNDSLKMPLFYRFAYFIDKNTSAAAKNITLDVYRPLSTLTFSFIYDIFGPAPWAFRLLTLAAHIANACLIYILAGLLGFNFFTAVFAAALFALNPSSAENITNVTGQSSVISCLLFLWAVILFIKNKQQPVKELGAVCVLYFCAMLFRETAIVLPFVLFAFSWFMYRKYFSVKFYAVLCSCTVLFMFMRTFVLGHASAGELWYYNIFLHLGMFIKYLFVEAPLSMLAPFLNHPLYHAVTLGNRPYAQASLLVSAAVIFAWLMYFFRKKIAPVFFVLLAWIFFTLLPVHNVPAADRFLYYALVPVCFIVGLLLNKTGNAKIAVAALYVGVMGYACGTQAKIWRNDKYFLLETVKRYPNDYIALVNYGRAAISNDVAPNEPAAAFAKAVAQHPPANQLVRILFDQGNVFIAQGRLDDAKAAYDKIVEINPKVWYAYLGYYYIAVIKKDIEAARKFGMQTVDAAMASPRVEVRVVKTTSGQNFIINDPVIVASLFVDN